MQALEKTKDNMSKSYDHYHQARPDYEVGDGVLCNVKNIQMVQLTKKLAPKRYRPFCVLDRIDNSTYQLELQSH
jgi:hypothetical protein